MTIHRENRQLHWTKYTCGHLTEEAFSKLFWDTVDNCAVTRSRNSRRKYLVTGKWNGYIYANSWYQFIVKLRVKVREVLNYDIYNYDAIMDSIDEYVENQRKETRPDMMMSIVHIINFMFDDLESLTSSRYDFRVTEEDVNEEADN